MSIAAKLATALVGSIVLFVVVYSALGGLLFDGSDQSGRSALGLALLITLPINGLAGWLLVPWLAK